MYIVIIRNTVCREMQLPSTACMYYIYIYIYVYRTKLQVKLLLATVQRFSARDVTAYNGHWKMPADGIRNPIELRADYVTHARASPYNYVVLHTHVY